MICASRSSEPSAIADMLEEYASLQEQFPDFLVGFDMVGQEDLGYPLIDFADILIQAKENHPNIEYYFHAGRCYLSHISCENHYSLA